jgi:3-methyladenine DNA glycosylase/8-oxoguanine DNA glycosylase
LTSPWADAPFDLRVEVTPPWPFRIGRGSGDGILRRRGATLTRLLHVGDAPVLVAVAQTAPRRVLFAARSEERAAAEAAIARMRWATGVDEDLRPFYERFAGDSVIGRAVRARPHVRIHRRAAPWEALAWAITEQLIELERAMEIQKRLVRRFGRRCPRSGLRDMPEPGRIAALAPAELQSYDLAARRAVALRHVAREVAAGRIDLADRARAWPRLAAIPNVGTWTLEMLSLYGQGHYDLVPAGDLGFIKLVGRLSTGNPKARADEAEVRGFFERYGEWKGLAGAYLFAGAATGRLTASVSPSPAARAPRPAGTRWSAPLRPPAAA